MKPSQNTNDFETAYPCSIEPNDEILACRLDHFLRDHLEFVRCQHMLYLEHKAINQTGLCGNNLTKNQQVCQDFSGFSGKLFSLAHFQRS